MGLSFPLLFDSFDMCFYVNLKTFPKKPFVFQKIVVPLHYQNPPSLSTMLKCAGRFIFIQ